MPLTVLAVENAKPREKAYLLTDGNGLHLVVTPNGNKLWRLRYRFGGKQNMLSLGTFPTIGLAAARSRRDDAQKLIADDVDPSQQRKLDQIARGVASKITFGAIVEEHLEILQEDRPQHPRSARTAGCFRTSPPRSPSGRSPRSRLQKFCSFYSGSKRPAGAKPHDGCAARSAAVFRRAITTLRATNDPTYALRGALRPPIVQHRAAIIDERELGALMVSIDEYDGWPTVRAALQLIALTMTRPIEIRLMRRSEINWPKATWSIPAERMKMRRPHEVPLSKQALEVLRSVWDFVRGQRSRAALHSLRDSSPYPRAP